VSIIVEGKTGFHLGGMATVLGEDNDREMAWAEKHVHKAPDVKWILGNFVQAATPETPTYNSNGHSFPYEDLKDSVQGIPHRPLNLVHLPNRRIGTFTAAEFVWPNGEAADEGNSAPPIVEALACFWHYYERDLWPSIEMAYKEGAAFLSMEAVPETITCRGKGSSEGCGKTYEYAGRQSPTYCNHLNEHASRKVLNKATFTGGALILPPVRPGWKHADIKELSQLIESNLDEAEKAYEEVAALTPHLDPKSWENIAAWFLKAKEI
jgi:hypothetical protein